MAPNNTAAATRTRNPPNAFGWWSRHWRLNNFVTLLYTILAVALFMWVATWLVPSLAADLHWYKARHGREILWALLVLFGVFLISSHSGYKRPVALALLWAVVLLVLTTGFDLLAIGGRGVESVERHDHYFSRTKTEAPKGPAIIQEPPATAAPIVIPGQPALAPASQCVPAAVSFVNKMNQQVYEYTPKFAEDGSGREVLRMNVKTIPAGASDVIHHFWDPSVPKPTTMTTALFYKCGWGSEKHIVPIVIPYVCASSHSMEISDAGVQFDGVMHPWVK